jgi:hypothetical protein
MLRPLFTSVVLGSLLLLSCDCGSRRGVFSEREAAEICATLFACFPAESNVWGVSLSACTTGRDAVPSPGTIERSPVVEDGLEPIFQEFYSCVLASRGNCDRAARCFAPDGVPGTCAPAGGLATGTCDAGVLEGCTADGHRFVVSCSRHGRICGPTGILTRFEGCTLGGCNPAGPTECVGEHAQLCLGFADAGTTLRLDCARLGQHCAVDDGGLAFCTAEPGDARRCEGNIAVSVDARGARTRTDCERNVTLRRCEEGACVRTGKECDATFIDTCDASQVVFCQDGFIRRLDCRSLGFSGCADGRCVRG